MNAIDPNTLPGMPAPFWFVELFKGIGFFLHLIPMHLWFAGLPFAILTLIFGGPLANRYARRVFGQMPIFLALGVNFAIVPLLFLQTTYYKSFYTATILTAWHWLIIIPLFLFAYYKVYLASFSVKLSVWDTADPMLNLPEKAKIADRSDKKKDNRSQPESTAAEEKPKKPRTRGRIRTVFFGFFAWLFLAVIGLLIAHAMNLMGRPDAWAEIWEKTNIGGAVTGLGNHFRDPILWTRFGSMFGLALITTGFWAVFDSHCLIRKNSSTALEEKNVAYRKWTLSFGARISWIGLIVTVCGFLYYFWLLDKNEEMKFLFQFPWVVLPVGLVVFPLILTVLLTRASRVGKIGLFSLIGLVLGQTLILGSFVVTRQLIQNIEVGRFVQVASIPEAVQWGPLYTFLGVFAGGLLVILWIVWQIATIKEKVH